MTDINVVTEITCLECGDEITGEAVCEGCFQDNVDNAGDDADEEVANLTRHFANEVDLLGDRIRDNLGDRESWWNRARDIAAELRKHG